jgi:tetratricopeptide (TPR) repeat protein
MGQAAVSPAPFFTSGDLKLVSWAVILFVLLLTSAAQAQQSKPAVPSTDLSAAAQQGLDLALKGNCLSALPLLKKGAHVAEKDLQKKVGLATVRCAMMMNQQDTAVSALLLLNREFPHDPEVLYLTTHAYSDLATRASQELAAVAPTSYQALELNGEALETQGKWKEAKQQYEEVLAQHPDLPGIHYRLGRIILSEPPTATTAEDARKEFEAELKIDPSNAGAEYVLGELARQTEQWDVAIEHFERATELDAKFQEAYRGLGMSLNAAGKFAEAVPPLERYVKLEPRDPAGHYQLAIAYARSGHQEQAQREMELQRQADENVRKEQGQAGDPVHSPPSPP